MNENETCLFLNYRRSISKLQTLVRVHGIPPMYKLPVEIAQLPRNNTSVQQQNMANKFSKFAVSDQKSFHSCAHKSHQSTCLNRKLSFSKTERITVNYHALSNNWTGKRRKITFSSRTDLQVQHALFSPESLVARTHEHKGHYLRHLKLGRVLDFFQSLLQFEETRRRWLFRRSRLRVGRIHCWLKRQRNVHGTLESRQVSQIKERKWLEAKLTKPPEELLERLDELSAAFKACWFRAEIVLFGAEISSVDPFSLVLSRPQRWRRIFKRSQYCCVSPSVGTPDSTADLVLIAPVLLLVVTDNSTENSSNRGRNIKAKKFDQACLWKWPSTTKFSMVGPNAKFCC